MSFRSSTSRNTRSPGMSAVSWALMARAWSWPLDHWWLTNAWNAGGVASAGKSSACGGRTMSPPSLHRQMGAARIMRTS